MNPLAALRSRGITLFLAGQSLKFKSDRGITPAEKESIRRNREEIIRLIQQEEETSRKCSDCIHFTGSWCSGISWDGKSFQRLEELHPCRNFKPGKHQMGPAYSPEVWETFESAVKILEGMPSLWPAIKSYLKRELPEALYMALETEYSGQDGPWQKQEWKSPYPSRCFDCFLQKGCTREEIKTWGLLNRHECSFFVGKGGDA